MQLFNGLVVAAAVFLAGSTGVSAATASVTVHTPPALSFPRLFAIDFNEAEIGDNIVVPGGRRVKVIVAENAQVLKRHCHRDGAIRRQQRDGASCMTMGPLSSTPGSSSSSPPDGHFGFFQFTGNTVLDPSTGVAKGFVRLNFETDAADFVKYNSWFIIGNFILNGTAAHIDLYGTDPATV
ncbi:hypothetical protein BKA62DRAFT_772084 [Auriculariales sp. MPI-PUGE-AT-0066]|nr:hypothetical protein BKA62DRAFT_772084 [Auriculariales sp. MPI-PUGE-AT-0066]